VSVEVLLFDPVLESAPDEWDRFAEQSGAPSLWHADLLSTLAWCAQTPTFMACVVDRSRACLAAFHVRYLGLPTSPRHFVTPGRLPVTGLLECRLHPGGSLAGHWFASDLAPGERAAAVTAFERTLRRRLSLPLTAVAYRNVPAADLSSLRRGRRLVRATNPDMWIENGWDSMDSYLASFPAHRRRRLQKLMRGIDVDPTLNVALEAVVPAERASRLVQESRVRHRPAFWVTSPLPLRYFDQLAHFHDVSFLNYRDGHGRLLAFAAVHDSGTELLWTLWGSLWSAGAPAGLARPSLYFDAYLRLVDLLIRLGRRRLVLGKGVASLKARYGARPHERFVVAGAW
jgi:hypothetical protein